ncbi:MAG: Ig-like domain repeat protein, partial [Candidatus Korobacteraceae bacterium]
VAVDRDRNLYIADTENFVIRKITRATGVITTIAGTPESSGYSGDDGAAIEAQLGSPFGVALDSEGSIYIADGENHLIRKVDPESMISTIAGNTDMGPGFSGDGGVATAAQLQLPIAVSVDGLGGIYISDGLNQRLRKVNVGNTALAFGEIAVGQSSESKSLTIRNAGTADLHLLDGSGSDHFGIHGATCSGDPATITPGATCVIDLAFAPQQGGEIEDDLTITSNASNSPHTISLTGIGIATAGPTTTALTVSPESGSVLLGQTITFTATVSAEGTPSGTVFFREGKDTIGSATLDDGIAVFHTTELEEGAHEIHARYEGSEDFEASTSNDVIVTVTVPPQAAETTTLLTASPAGEITSGSTVTFTATVASTTTVASLFAVAAPPTIPDGTVTFFDGQTVLGAVSLDGGHAVLETSSLAVGQHSITAHYEGNSAFLASTSTPVDVTVASPPQPDYTLTANPSSITITRGQQVQTTITLTPLHGFTGTVALSCGPLPLGVTCTFTPASLVSNGESPVTSTLVIRTTGTQLAAVHPHSPDLGWLLASLGVFGMLLMGSGSRKRTLLVGLLLAVLLLGLAACGDGNPTPQTNPNATPVGPATVTVTAGAAAGGGGTPQHNVQLTITIVN